MSRSASRIPVALVGTALAWLAVFGVYLALGQRALHGFDVHYLLRVVDSGVGISGRHVLYVPIVRAVKDLSGASAHGAMMLTSAAFGALGVVSVFWACRAARVPWRASLLAALTAGALPGVLHFATVAEINGLAFGMESLAWVAFWGVLRLEGRAVLGFGGVGLGFGGVGVATGLSAGAHAIGHLQPLVLALVLLLGVANPPQGAAGERAAWPLGWRLACIATLAVGHALANWAAVSAVASAGAAIAENSSVVRDLAPWVGIGQLPRILWQEWLYPLAPLCVLFVVGARSAERRVRRLTLAVALCAAASWGVSLVLLGPLHATERYLPGGVLAEFGAYAFYLVMPAALIVVRVLPLRGAAATALVACVLGGLHWQSWRREGYRDERARQMVALASAAPSRFLVGGHDELTPLVLAMPQANYRSVYDLALELLASGESNPEAAGLWFDFERARDAAAGVTWYVTEGALERLEADPLPALRRLGEHLRRDDRLVPVGDSGVFEVRAR